MAVWRKGPDRAQSVENEPAARQPVSGDRGYFAFVLGTLFHRTTDAALPFLDSATTSTSLVAQWMMTKKLLENWLVWVAVDVVYIGMFIYKSLYVTALLYLCSSCCPSWATGNGRRRCRSRSSCPHQPSDCPDPGRGAQRQEWRTTIAIRWRAQAQEPAASETSSAEIQWTSES